MTSGWNRDRSRAMAARRTRSRGSGGGWQSGLADDWRAAARTRRRRRQGRARPARCWQASRETCGGRTLHHRRSVRLHSWVTYPPCYAPSSAQSRPRRGWPISPVSIHCCKCATPPCNESTFHAMNWRESDRSAIIAVSHVGDVTCEEGWNSSSESADAMNCHPARQQSPFAPERASLRAPGRIHAVVKCESASRAILSLTYLPDSASYGFYGMEDGAVLQPRGLGFVLGVRGRRSCARAARDGWPVAKGRSTRESR